MQTIRTHIRNITYKRRPQTGRYNDAIDILNKLHDHPLRKQRSAPARESPKDRTKRWIELLGIKEKLQNINYIHVAGTKGKGTTCLYLEGLLSAYQRTRQVPQKIGCLTSPHLTDIRERIRLNSSYVSKDLFAAYVFRLWDEIQQHCSSPDSSHSVPAVPGYPSFLTLLAFYIFVHEQVELAVIETGIGGENDSTNVICHPAATGITALGLDHVEILGNSIDKIAWHKAGIFKRGSQAFTVPQEKSAMDVLIQRSDEKGTAGLHVVTEETVNRYGLAVYPDMRYQKLNASLAISLADTALKRLDANFVMTAKIARSIEKTGLPGRSEVIVGERNTWLLSAAHNEISVREASSWIKRTLRLPEHANAPRVLIFNHDSKRDAKALLAIVYKNLCGDEGFPLSAVVFCSNNSGLEEEKLDLFDYRRKPIHSLQVQESHAAAWADLGGSAPVNIFPTVKEAIEFVEASYVGARVIVAGSLYLAGTVRYMLGASVSDSGY